MRVPGFGLDYSTRALHLARVCDDVVQSRDVLPIAALPERTRHSHVQHWLHKAQADICFGGWSGATLVLERPWLGDNAETTVLLALLAGELRTLAFQAGYQVRLLTPAQWRSWAGIDLWDLPVRHVSKQPTARVRAQLKRAAVDRVKLEYGISVDDNAAEAILMARVAYGLARQAEAVETL